MSKVAILFGSVYGAAEDLAETIASNLKKQSIEAKLFSEDALADVLSFEPTTWLIVTSTTGMGDVPDNLVGLHDELRESFPDLSAANYAVVAMGDSSYVDSYCGAGKQFDELMKELMAKPLLDALEIDAVETMDPVGFAEDWVNDFISKL